MNKQAILMGVADDGFVECVPDMARGRIRSADGDLSAPRPARSDSRPARSNGFSLRLQSHLYLPKRCGQSAEDLCALLCNQLAGLAGAAFSLVKESDTSGSSTAISVLVLRSVWTAGLRYPLRT